MRDYYAEIFIYRLYLHLFTLFVNRYTHKTNEKNPGGLNNGTNKSFLEKPCGSVHNRYVVAEL